MMQERPVLSVAGQLCFREIRDLKSATKMIKTLAISLALLGLCSLSTAMSVPSYEGFKVFRVKVADRDSAARLHQIGDDLGEFWSDLPGRHADIMVAPHQILSFSRTLQENGFEFSTMIENIAGEFLASHSYSLRILVNQ